MNGEIFLVDTNVLLYAYDKKDPVKQQLAQELLDACWQRKTAYAISLQNLSEFFVTATRKKLLSKRDAVIAVRDFLGFDCWKKIESASALAFVAAALAEQYDMPYYDSLLAATMKHNGVLHLYTENTKDFKIPWLHVVNPFAPKH